MSGLNCSKPVDRHTPEYEYPYSEYGPFTDRKKPLPQSMNLEVEDLLQVD